MGAIVLVKVLIIDDEPIIREGLKRTMDWGQLGCEVIGEAENGMEAVDKVKVLQPDIIITDIMMPGLGGLELTRLVKESFPHMKIIFLTGYNNFAYAQQAIKLGAFDFVLKPTNTDELKNVIVKARNEIVSASKSLQQQENMKRMLEASLPLLKDKFISDLLYSPIDNPEDILGKMKFFTIQLESFVVLCVEIDNYNDFKSRLSEEEKFFYMLSVKEKILELLERCKIPNILYCEQNTFAVILHFGKEESEDILKGSIISIAEELRNKIENHFSFTVSVGISHYYSEIQKIRLAYREALLCLDNRFYIGNNSTIHIDDIFSFEGFSALNDIDTKPIMEAIKAGNTEKIKREWEGICKRLSHNAGQTFIRNMCTEIIAAASRLYCELYGTMEDIFIDGVIPFEQLVSARTAAELFETAATVIEGICRQIDEKQNSQTRKVITKALEYINANYARDISLNDVAEYVYMSPWYFSKLFKKESGLTFSEFLLKARIDKAMEFLKSNLELKAYEVAEKVGFNDARYFGQIFKKATGMTPSEYRERA